MTGKKNKILTIVVVVILAVLIIALGLLLRSKNKTVTPYTNATIAMGTDILESFYADDESLAEEAATKSTKIINELDNTISWRVEGSQIEQLNTLSTASINETVYDCLKTCCEISEKTNGLFDVTIGKLTDLWGIGTEYAQVPTFEDIGLALTTVDYKTLTLTNDGNGSFTVEMYNDQKVDLGAVGKGLACDQIKSYLITTDITGGTVSVGGSILVYGTNPSAKDGTWNIAVRDPFGKASEYFAVVNVKEGFFSTSGDYEKVFVAEDGTKYHHILSPKTGFPAKSNVSSVTVFADSGIITDALSTSCFMLGYGEDSLKLLRDYNAEAIFVTSEKEVYVTSGLSDCTTIVDDSFTLQEVAA